MKKDVVSTKSSVPKSQSTTESSDQTLKLSEERFEKMISEVEDYAIILLDLKGHIISWNKGAERIKGYDSNEIIGKSFKVFYSKEDIEKRLPDELIRIAKQNGKAVYEGWRIRKDGTQFWGNITLTAIHNEEGIITGYLKVTRDLTEKKKAEDQVKAHAEELEDKNKALEALNNELSSYAYIVSHDLKEPVRKIRIFAARQKESGKSMEQLLDYSDKIEQSAVKMQNLMNDLLAYSELSMENSFKDVDLNQVLRSVKYDLEVLISEKQAMIHSSKLPVIKGITHQIQQLFLNLISNALKFSKPNEKPELKIVSSEAGGSTLSEDLKDKNYIEVCFIDNGIGFSPEHSKKIFEVFQRLHPKESTGSGIGLAIVKKVMLNHSGFVSAESEPGKGTTFKIYFPKP